MPTITLKNIPDELYAQLKAAAQAHRRSLNNEILYCVERILSPQKLDVAKHLREARLLQARTASRPITNKVIQSAKNNARL